MAKAPTKKAKAKKGFEDTLWDTANQLRGSVESSEYKHVVLSLVFLKFISDKFEARRKQMEDEGQGDFLEMEVFYQQDNIFYLPEEARWSFIKQNAKQDDIAVRIDTALSTIEKRNPSLKGALPDNYFSRQNLETKKLASLIDTIDNIETLAQETDVEALSKEDLVGRVYEYFLGKFAATEGKGGGEFYTPKCVVTLLTEMLEPFQGKIYDPCCGSAGMFVQSVKFVESHQGKSRDIALPGQLFFTTQIPVCLWFMTKSKAADPAKGYRNRQGETLFIDARNLGTMINRTTKELTADDIATIADTYHAWRSTPEELVERVKRGDSQLAQYEDQAGFCKVATIAEIKANDSVLTPGRYVGAAEQEDDGVAFETKMRELSQTLFAQMKQAEELDNAIRQNLEVLGYGI
ncbi:N-6 DNA methylase [Salmonella enterica subsp. enterica serovar Enteritidis]|nr:N-6 DNA methylase [Salmonella enterica subsp. enterica serovar Enteritidis]